MYQILLDNLKKKGISINAAATSSVCRRQLSGQKRMTAVSILKRL